MNEQNGNIVIWGVTSLGKYLADHIKQQNKKLKPLAFVDNNSKICNTYIKNIPVISCDDLGTMKNVNDIIVLLAVKNAKNIFQILEQLEHIQVGKVGIVKCEVLLSGTFVDPWIPDDKIVWNVFGENTRRIVPYIEVNLIDACNLKCKGCTHFSSLYDENSVYPINEYKKDLLKLRKIGQFFRLRLLGGEPFLLKNIKEYILITRKIFPESTIEIVTNGLLITKVEKSIMTAIKENNVCIIISLYPPTYKIKNQIEEYLNYYDILYNFDTGGDEKKIVKFYRNLTLNYTHDAKISNNLCSSAICTFLRKGRLYKCPFDALINDFYHYYGLQMENESGISLDQNNDFLYSKLKEYAYNPIKLCKYCSEKPEGIPWQVEAAPSLHDWLYKEGK